MMCGRFTLRQPWAEVRNALSIIPETEAGRNAPARYNIAPTQDVLFVANVEDKPAVQEGMWWLVPFWAKERPKYPTFNARSETAHEKSSFRQSFKSKRCLIPADGYYEWTEGEDGGKDPHLIHLPDNEPFAFAGLWAHNSHLDIISCTILTAPADDAIKTLHDRMPIILRSDGHADWLSGDTSVDGARTILNDHRRGGSLTSYRVGREVNSSRAHGPDLIAPAPTLDD